MAHAKVGGLEPNFLRLIPWNFERARSGLWVNHCLMPSSLHEDPEVVLYVLKTY